jgi:hypothetical protein
MRTTEEVGEDLRLQMGLIGDPLCVEALVLGALLPQLLRVVIQLLPPNESERLAHPTVREPQRLSDHSTWDAAG